MTEGFKEESFCDPKLQRVSNLETDLKNHFEIIFVRDFFYLHEVFHLSFILLNILYDYESQLLPSSFYKWGNGNKARWNYFPNILETVYYSQCYFMTISQVVIKELCTLNIKKIKWKAEKKWMSQGLYIDTIFRNIEVSKW